MRERVRFVLTYEAESYSMTELCEHFSISRKTGYKWLERYRSDGLDGLNERSRAPYNCPHRTPKVIEDRIIAFKEKHRSWGPRKLRCRLQVKYPEIQWPPKSTIGDILERHNLTTPRRRRTRRPNPGAGPLQTTAPNQIWSVDFKGEALVDRRYCYPLTMLDSESRFLLACHGLRSIAAIGVRPIFEHVFDRYGLPEAIRTDNGAPFVSQGMLGLTRLSVWWIQLGIIHQRIRPGRPQENGRHERMHRTLKEETMMPPAKTMSAQQRRFDAFRHEYNCVRPHESLDDDVPTSTYEPSQRKLPDRIVEPDYPGHFEIRKVGSGGKFKFKNQHIFLSEALSGEYIGLEEIDHGIWDIVYYKSHLARYNENNQRIA